MKRKYILSILMATMLLQAEQPIADGGEETASNNTLFDAEPMPEAGEKINSSTQMYDIKITPTEATTNPNNISQQKLPAIIRLLKDNINNNPNLFNNVENKKFVQEFYAKNDYTPIWVDEAKIYDRADKLIKEIGKDATIESSSDILKRQKALGAKIKQLKNAPTQKLMSLEVELTDLYYSFLNHSLYGDINWKKFQSNLAGLRAKKITADWITYKAPYNLTDLILEPDIDDTIDRITPRNFNYRPLLKAYTDLKNIQSKGGWIKVPSKKSILQLKSRLKQSHDYKCKIESTTMDGCMVNAVKKFQDRNALDTTGTLNSKTLNVLNRDIGFDLDKIKLNLNRIKWMPRTNHSRYGVVNIPDFKFYFYDNGLKETINVIVGDKSHHTPVFSNKITYLVLNPYWKVPEGIVKNEIAPHMLKNRGYLASQGLEIHKDWNPDSERINPSSINWSLYAGSGAKAFPYAIMQPPGNSNALGKIKFKFPNEFSVYMHDTPNKKLFKTPVRAYSHGCVRVGEPMKLFDIISSFNGNIDKNRAKNILKGTKEIDIGMTNGLPIHLIYLTAKVNANGDLEYSPDIYGYDKLQN
ncbi:MAG: L,D-transpeptidase family protein [Epsilonproteobacteria bacterium]|nr:L,D-transpeptidase family protein [Campylobacterota bacterium]MBD3838864.1 L,D-transpeptidase family protein [Campylobacterota bacterium]